MRECVCGPQCMTVSAVWRHNESQLFFAFLVYKTKTIYRFLSSDDWFRSHCSQCFSGKQGKRGDHPISRHWIHHHLRIRSSWPFLSLPIWWPAEDWWRERPRVRTDTPMPCHHDDENLSTIIRMVSVCMFFFLSLWWKMVWKMKSEAWYLNINFLHGHASSTGYRSPLLFFRGLIYDRQIWPLAFIFVGIPALRSSLALEFWSLFFKNSTKLWGAWLLSDILMWRCHRSYQTSFQNGIPKEIFMSPTDLNSQLSVSSDWTLSGPTAEQLASRIGWIFTFFHPWISPIYICKDNHSALSVWRHVHKMCCPSPVNNYSS